MNFRTRLLVIGSLLIAWGARVNALGAVPFWYDEGLVGWSARLSFIDTARWTSADVHPPLYFWAVTVWRWFVGESEFALRLLSVAFGLLSVVAVYKIGERLNGPKLGALAALLIGLARFHIWWSQELRMYILGSMFMLFSIWLALRILHGKPKRADWIAFVLVSAAGLWSLYLVAFALAFEGLYATILLALHLSSRAIPQGDAAKQKRKEELDGSSPSPLSPLPQGVGDFPSPQPSPTRRGGFEPFTFRKYLQWVGAQVCVALIFIPWFVYFLTQYRTWSDSTPFDFKLFLQFYTTMLAVGVPANIDLWLAPMLVIWAVLLAGALVGLRGSHGATMRRGGWLVVLLLVLPPLTVYLGTTPRSFFYSPRVEPRYLFPFIWSFYLVLAWCVYRLAQAQRWLGVAAALLVVGLSASADANYYEARVPNDVYQSLTAMLRAQRLPGDGVVLDDDRNWPIFEYYYAGGVKDWIGVPNGSRIKAGDVDFILGATWQAHDGLWLVWNEDALRIDENHVLEQWLAERSVYTQETVFGTKRLIFYARTPARAQQAGTLAANAKPTYSLNSTVADGLTLRGYDQATLRYRVGDEILLGTYWQSTRATNVTAILQDARGTEHGRQTLAIPAGVSRLLVRYPVTTDLDPASYHIVVAAGAQTPSGRGGTAVALALAQIDQPDVAPVSPDVAIQTPVDVRFQNGIRLMGYDTAADTLRPGDNLLLTLYWQTSAPIAQRYKVFVHILGLTFNPKTKNPLWGQQDQEPLNGGLPTTSWGINRLISDPYLVKLAPEAPSGKYTIELGWYHPVTGERLQVVGADGKTEGDHTNLFEVDVR